MKKRPSQKRSRLYRLIRDAWKLPTDRVGGAIIVRVATGLVPVGVLGAVLMNVLGESRPPGEQLRARTASGSSSVAINVDQIWAPNEVIDDLDPERFYADRRSRFFLPLPDIPGLVISKNDTPKYFSGLSAASLPFADYALDSIRSIVRVPVTRSDDVLTTDFRVSRNRLTLSRESTIGFIRVDYNPLSDPNLSAAAFDLWLNFIVESPGVDAGAAEKARSSSKLRGLATETMQESVDAAIRSRVPVSLPIHQGIAIKSFRKAYILESPLAGSLNEVSDLTAFSYFFVLQLLNTEIATLSLRTVAISTNNHAILVDSSTTVRSAELDGNFVEDLELVKFFLLINSPQYIHIVRLQYINGFHKHRVEKELEQSFAGFRIPG